MQRVLVTGANRGIGLEFARQLLTRGARVIADRVLGKTGIFIPCEAQFLARDNLSFERIEFFHAVIGELDEGNGFCHGHYVRAGKGTKSGESVVMCRSIGPCVRTAEPAAVGQ